jgi:hypothetical protein
MGRVQKGAAMKEVMMLTGQSQDQAGAVKIFQTLKRITVCLRQARKIVYKSLMV